MGEIARGDVDGLHGVGSLLREELRGGLPKREGRVSGKQSEEETSA